ncbi:MAG: hypothetical protein IPJ65_33270 [Archangiaceae bacterium]|nr:hypothetical protein [Archangiaceae bacterium]
MLPALTLLALAQLYTGPRQPLTQAPAAEPWRGVAYHPLLVPSGADFIAVWSDDRGPLEPGKNLIFAAHLRADGSRVEPTGRLLIADADSGEIAAATDGSQLLVVYPRRVWLGASQLEVQVAAQRFDASLNAVGGPVRLSANAAPGAPIAATWDGTQYQISYGTVFAGVWGRSLARVSTNGVVLATTSLDNLQTGGVALASTGGVTAVMWSAIGAGPATTRTVKLRRFAASGSAVDVSPLTLSLSPPAQEVVALAARNSEFLAVWAVDTTAYATRLGVSGAPVDAPALVLGSTHGYASKLGAAWSGSEWHTLFTGRATGVSTTGGVRLDTMGGNRGGPTMAPSIDVDAFAWSTATGLALAQNTPTERSTVMSVRFDGTLTALDTAPVHQVFAAPNQDRVAVASNGTLALAAWVEQLDRSSDARLVAARFDGSGRRLDGVGIEVAPRFDSIGGAGGYSPSVTWDGTSFLVAWSHANGSNGMTVSAARVSPGGALLDPPGGFAVLGLQSVFDTAISTAVNGTTLVCTKSAMACARVDPSGAVLDLNPVKVLPTNLTEGGLGHDGSRFVVSWVRTQIAYARTIEPATFSLGAERRLSANTVMVQGTKTRVISSSPAVVVWSQSQGMMAATYEAATSVASAPFAAPASTGSSFFSADVAGSTVATLWQEDEWDSAAAAYVRRTRFQRLTPTTLAAIDATPAELGGAFAGKVPPSSDFGLTHLGTAWVLVSSQYLEGAGVENMRVFGGLVGAGAADGTTCTAPAQCGSGVCATGICCATTCNGVCTSGTCQTGAGGGAGGGSGGGSAGTGGGSAGTGGGSAGTGGGSAGTGGGSAGTGGGSAGTGAAARAPGRQRGHRRRQRRHRRRQRGHVRLHVDASRQRELR